MKPIELVSKVLARHGLQKSDGRPLYQYRILDDEFNELQGLIKTSSVLGFDNISQHLPLWDAAMVLYASEWWRRHYEGKWGWEGVFDSVGISQYEFSTPARNQLVEFGLQRWQRSVREVGGRRQFLGTVATEGGLPLRQLAEAGGWLKNLLRPVVKKHLERGLPVDALIEAYIEVVPKSYRSIEVRQILEDMVHSVCDLRQKHNLDEKDEPIQWLDNNDPRWRERFPLPIDDDAGKSLLSELVTAAAKTNVLSSASTDTVFQMERFIERPDFSPQLVASLTLPTHIPLAFFEAVDKASLPGRVALEVVSDSDDAWRWCFGIQTIYKGEPVYKLSGRTFKLSGEKALGGYHIRIKYEGVVLYEFPILSAERLDDDSPWMFKVVNERYEYFGSQSQSTSDELAAFYLRDDFNINALGEHTTVERRVEFRGGALHTLSGNVACENGIDKYTLKTNAKDSEFSFELVGERYEGLSRPSEIYLGVPEVYKRNNITGVRRRLDFGRLVARPVGDTCSWEPIGQIGDGFYELRLLMDDAIVWRKRVGIISSDFSVSLKPNRRSPLEGKVLLSSCSDYVVTAESEESRVYVSSETSECIVSFEAKENVPSLVSITVLPKGSLRELVFTLPFPSSGALLYSPKSKQVPQRTLLQLENLYGYRLRVFDESYAVGKTAELRFTLIDNTMDTDEIKDIYVDKTLALSGPVTELALIDWQPLMQSLLGVGRGLDSRVQMSLAIRGDEKVRLKFSRYENSLVCEWDNGLVRLSEYSFKQLDVETLQKAKLRALRLNQPEQGDVFLEPILSSGVPQGSWGFDVDKRESGNWLIYPDASSSIKFRPLLWIVEDSLTPSSDDCIDEIRTLPKATYISDFAKRELAIRNVLKLMGEDLEHKSWGYLSHLTERSEHLPLATFDIWRVCAGEPKFLAALFVKTGFEELIVRLQNELPIIWELVRLQDWVSVLNAYRTKLVSSIQSNDGLLGNEENEIIALMLDKKISAINDLSVSMNSLAKILRQSVSAQKDKELQAMALPADFLLGPGLKSGQQELLRRQADTTWPKMLGAQINDISDGLPDVLQNLVDPPHDFQKPIFFLPMVLAWRMNTSEYYGWLGNAGNIFKLDQLKAFDEDWFNTSFNLTSGWISQHAHEFKN